MVTQDGKSHDIKLYYDNSAEPVVNDSTEQVEWCNDNDLDLLVMGTKAQTFNGDNGSDRIDWGYLYTIALGKDNT